ncbi:MAG: class GN sortase [Xanthomonadales bacterium]|nr:class GN sortase [Xanthomonadales bacterium]
MTVGAALAAITETRKSRLKPLPRQPANRSPHRLYAAALIAAAFYSFALLLNAAWIPLKAELAQWLIERSWQQVLDGGAYTRPWPWADTRPAAVLEVPGHGIRLMVLEGNSGRNLAFGPVFTDGTADSGDMVISGHRDTHFRFLENLERGERLKLTRKDSVILFEIVQIDIVDSRATQMLLDPGMDRVSLVTCYPFDDTVARGPMRYIVTALPVNEPPKMSTAGPGKWASPTRWPSSG